MQNRNGPEKYITSRGRFLLQRKTKPLSSTAEESGFKTELNFASKKTLEDMHLLAISQRISSKSTSAAQPSATEVVDDKEETGEDPGDGVTGGNGFNGVEIGNTRMYPNDTEDADPEAGHDHRNDRVSGSTDGTGENLDADVGNPERNQEEENLNTAVDDDGILCEDAVYVFSKQAEEGTENNGGAGSHRQTDTGALVDAVIFAGTEVLSHKGGDRDTECTDHHPENSIDFSIGCPGSNGIGAEGVDTGLHKNVGETVHNRL